MALSKNDLKAIIELKKENEYLQERVNHLKRENFEYSIKINHMKNVVANVETIVKENPSRLVEASENLCRTIQCCNEIRLQRSPATVPTIPDNNKDLTKETPAKDDAVTPSVVNGSNIATVIETQVNAQGKEPAVQSTLTDIKEPDANNSTQDLHSIISEISHSEDTSEASSSHSSSLSETSKEVKIYLYRGRQDGHSKRSVPGREDKYGGPTDNVTKRNKHPQYHSEDDNKI